MQSSGLVRLSFAVAALAVAAAPAAGCVGDDFTVSDAAPDAGADGPTSSGDAAPAQDASAPDAVAEAGPPCVLAKGTSGAKDPAFKNGTKPDITANGTTSFKIHGGFPHDGNIYVYGGASGCAGMGATPGVARYTAAGELDTTFGAAGIGCMQLSANAEPWTGARDPKTGRIVLGGTAESGGTKRISLVCLKANGTPDTSCLGGAGYVDFALTGSPATAYPGVSALAVAFDAAGRIVVAGGDGDPFTTATWGFLARLDPTTGNNDPTFAGGNPVFNNGLAGFSAVLMDGNTILAAGASAAGVSDAGRWKVYRYLENGLMDPTWADNGVSSYDTAAHSTSDTPRRMVRNPTNGSFAVAGLGGGFPAVNSYGAGGTLSSSYAAPSASWNPGYVLDGLAAQCDGKLLLGAWADPATAGDFVTRVDPASGKVDSTFAGAGFVENLAAGDAFGSVMFDDKNGMIVVATNHANKGVSLFRLIP